MGIFRGAVPEAAPPLGKSLPSEARQALSLATFRQQGKMELFPQALKSFKVVCYFNRDCYLILVFLCNIDVLSFYYYIASRFGAPL